MIWLYLSLIGAFLWALASIIDEYTIDRYIKNPMLNTLIYSLIGLISALFIFGLKGPYPISWFELVLSLTAGITYVITIDVYFKALKEDEVTRVIPLFSLSSISTIILGTLILKEYFMPVTYLGMLLIIGGSILISIKSSAFKKKSSKISKAVIFMAIGGLFSGISAVIEKYLLNGGIPVDILFGYTRIGVAIPSFIIFIFSRDEIKRLIFEKKHHVFRKLVGSETLTIAGTYLVFLAISLGPLVLVSSLLTVEPLFTLIIATALGLFFPKILKQELNKKVLIQKISAITLIVLGLILIGG